MLMFPPNGFPPNGGFPPAANGAPTTPPPAYEPPAETYRYVDPGAIALCRFKWTSLVLTNGQRMWFWVMYVGPRSVAGFTWVGGRPGFTGVDLAQINQFSCV